VAFLSARAFDEIGVVAELAHVQQHSPEAGQPEKVLVKVELEE
jgi:hypothetical protein